MQIDLDLKRATVGIGEFSTFSIGPKDGSGVGSQGIWRAHLGTHWHNELRGKTSAEDAAARFEVVIEGPVMQHGWTIQLSGRIDQQVGAGPTATVREIKSVSRGLPAPEDELRTEYPEYFIQAATYAALLRLQGTAHRAELVFVEASSGLTQVVPLTQQDEVLFRNQLESVVQFLTQKLASRERLRTLAFRPAFRELRAGQESAAKDLTSTVLAGRSAVLFEAPTGFGKTGILLESALTLLKAGHVERVIYLTGKATGQWQVAATVGAMTAPAPGDLAANPIGVWQVRNKGEHCVNEVFLCVRDACPRLDHVEQRWKDSGLGAYVMDSRNARDMETIRALGRAAQLCPYEITRAALCFNEVWIGDLNYVFSPSVKPLFFNQPGFAAGRTLLIVDEAHNLPGRVADAYSSSFSGSDSWSTGEALRRVHSPKKIIAAWEAWTRFLDNLPESPGLSAAEEDDAKHLLKAVAASIAENPVDYAVLGPEACQALWRSAEAAGYLDSVNLPMLWWSPKPGQLSVTCLDAAAAIGASLKEFAGVILSTATPGPTEVFAEVLGLSDPQAQTPPARLDTPDRFGTLTKKETKKLSKLVTRGTSLLIAAEEKELAALAVVQADAPWRAGAYTVAYDLRADTRYQYRAHTMPITAQTVIEFHQSLGAGEKLAVFFSSFAYAEAVLKLVAALPDSPVAVIQPRKGDIASQASWVERSLSTADILFLVLGSGFAEGVDLLGGRVHGAMVVGPALPEVNPVQRARLATLSVQGREHAVERVYRVPGMQKVNQALGRLVRAPGQRARVLLHCVRFGETAFNRLLAPEYQGGVSIENDLGFRDWVRAANRA